MSEPGKSMIVFPPTSSNQPVGRPNWRSVIHVVSVPYVDGVPVQGDERERSAMTDDELAAIEADFREFEAHARLCTDGDMIVVSPSRCTKAAQQYLAYMPRLLSKIAVLQTENAECLAVNKKMAKDFLDLNDDCNILRGHLASLRERVVKAVQGIKSKRDVECGGFDSDSCHYEGIATASAVVLGVIDSLEAK